MRHPLARALTAVALAAATACGFTYEPDPGREDHPSPDFATPTPDFGPHPDLGADDPDAGVDADAAPADFGADFDAHPDDGDGGPPPPVDGGCPPETDGSFDAGADAGGGAGDADPCEPYDPGDAQAPAEDAGPDSAEWVTDADCDPDGC